MDIKQDALIEELKPEIPDNQKQEDLKKMI